MSSPRSSTFLVLGTVVLMIGLQVVAKYLPGSNSLKREKPGPTRGDLVLVEDDLPAELEGWTRTKFIPAPPVDELPEGQYWWVHQWQYQKDETSALVSFDQLGEDRWHELTYCYTALDWTIDQRSEHNDTGAAGSFVIARMSKNDSQHGLLVFSVFFSDGQWDTPPDIDLYSVNTWNKHQDLATRMADRFQQPELPSRLPEERLGTIRRALQCQVFVVSAEQISESTLGAAVELHLKSRTVFRSQWLADRRTPLASQNQ